ncbi:UDP-N-acetylglucosamine transferase subunit ALG14 homolog [Zerene cesonia]|uniref:UDP-N-acetylglucosamine transferase subunit ALG14 homolog n=1 Tax=Zerene cesonia TaxID=33412 RepID=UPI0018E513F0|nr:UDP-N-acetylglucosamine transferase subunit ALG14 homolog [Zerene cesonia]
MGALFVIIQSVIVFPLAFLILRALYLIGTIYSRRIGLHIHNRTFRTILCIGSGGHTTEMLTLVSRMKLYLYTPRLYVMADSDHTSEVKVRKMESQYSDSKITKIPRSRNVNQSYVSSVFTTIYATLSTIPVIYKFKPDLIFCNGPGTCIPICVVAFIMRCLFLVDCRIVFIESLCRVHSLSLTGKILQYIADIFVVQWLQLHKICLRSSYYGRLT